MTNELKEIALQKFGNLCRNYQVDQEWLLGCLDRFLAALPKPEPVGEVVAFSSGCHEVSWKKGKLPALGTQLYTTPPDQIASLNHGDKLYRLASELQEEKEKK